MKSLVIGELLYCYTPGGGSTERPLDCNSERQSSDPGVWQVLRTKGGIRVISPVQGLLHAASLPLGTNAKVEVRFQSVYIALYVS